MDPRFFAVVEVSLFNKGLEQPGTIRLAWWDPLAQFSLYIFCFCYQFEWLEPVMFLMETASWFGTRNIYRAMGCRAVEQIRRSQHGVRGTASVPPGVMPLESFDTLP